MGKVHSAITSEFQEFIQRQPLFFTATAPLDPVGHVNLSPKGLNTFRVISPHEVAYLDVTGSGNETSAHLSENGRIVFMFCAFEGNPRILRLYGRGRVILPDAEEWSAWVKHFELLPGTRQIIAVTVTRVQTSCGFSVPVMNLVKQREDLVKWAKNKGANGLADYHRDKNLKSIDGLRAPLAQFYEEQ
jgi:hypothetical protein